MHKATERGDRVLWEGVLLRWSRGGDEEVRELRQGERSCIS